MSRRSIFVSIGFPFTDLRSFLDKATFRLSVPEWPLAKPSSKEFVRSSGSVASRLGGGIDDWPGEEVYGRAATALRFPNRLETRNLGETHLPFSARFAFRRFYSDGRIARLEIGLRLNTTAEAPESLGADSCLAIIHNCLTIPVRIPSVSRRSFVTCPLLEAGRPLAEHYLRSSTGRVDSKLPAIEKWWFTAGDPVLILHYRPTSLMAALPPHSKAVQVSPGQDFSIAYCLVERNRVPVKTWLLGSEHESDKDRLRRFRIHLIRLHAEREGLKEVLRRIGRQQLALATNKSDYIQSYLNSAVTLLERRERFGFDQSALIDSAKYLVDFVAPGERATILAELQSARLNIVKKVVRLTDKSTEGASIANVFDGATIGSLTIGRIEMKSIRFGDNTTVMGDFTVTVAEKIENSFNKAVQSGVPDALKEQLKSLSTQVAEMVQKLPAKDAEDAARDLETLTHEAISPQPRKKWYSLSGEGLISAAKTVGAIAGPVITTVKAILALLG
jgi:hypothetical protein